MAEKTKYLTLQAETSSSHARKSTLAAPIIWAVDPEEREAKNMKPILGTMELFAECLNAEIEPVSVLAPIALDWPAELVAPLKKKIVSIRNQTITPLLKRLPSTEEMTPTLLIQKIASRRQAACTLLDLAKKRRAAFVAVNTHGRRGLERMRMGSFAEMLIAHSNIPVLAIGPKAKAPKRISSILFPTDLSPQSQRAFKKVLVWAKEFGARVDLFHVHQDPIPYMAYSEWDLGINPVFIDRLIQDNDRHEARPGRTWVDTARRLGVACEYTLSNQTTEVANAILDRARQEGSDLIAFNSAMTPMAQRFLGGVTKDVLGSAPCPVLVLPVQSGKSRR